ncbi:unnamed protein product, partial [Allacma fusca]
MGNLTHRVGNTQDEWVYILAVTLYGVYSMFRTYYFNILNGTPQSLLLIVDAPILRIGVQIFYVVFDLLHNSCIYFAFSFIYLFGMEITRNLDDVSDRITCIGQSSDVNGSNHDIVTIKENPVTKGSVQTDFMELKKCLDIYAEIGGVFFIAVALEVFPDCFRAINHLIFSVEYHFENVIFIVGTVAGGILFVLVANVGHRLERTIHKSKDHISHMIYGCDCSKFRRDKINIGKRFLHWRWDFSAAGLFNINRRIIPSVCALMVSYILIIFQMKISGDCSEKCNNSSSITRNTP